MHTSAPDVPFLLLSEFDGEFSQEIQVQVAEEFGVNIGSLKSNSGVREGESRNHQSGQQYVDVASGGWA